MYIQNNKSIVVTNKGLSESSLSPLEYFKEICPTCYDVSHLGVYRFRIYYKE